eukprot:5853063-Alexandrium_andersonii.AAC.1
MSASLVGSGDVYKRQARILKCTFWAGLLPTRAQHAFFDTRNALRYAVSYTHLTLPTICSV